MKPYKHILVPTDGSSLSLKAAKTAAALAKSLKAKMTAVYVIPPFVPPMMDEASGAYGSRYIEVAYREANEKNAARALGKVSAVAKTARVACAELRVPDSQAWQGIIRAARVKKCDLIIMASHGRRGLAGVILGSETQKVLTHSKTPVLVCR